MKVRVRLQTTTKTLSLGDGNACDYNLNQLREKIKRDVLEKPVSFHLSLNKSDHLIGDDTKLSEFGIVSGDLIFITLDTPLPTDQNVLLDPEPSQHGQKETPVHDEVRNLDLETSGLTADSICMLSSDRNPDSERCIRTQGDVNMTTSSDTLEHVETHNTDDPMEGSSGESGVQDDPVVNKCLQEPLLCREATSEAVPPLLWQLYSAAKCNKKADALWVVVHTLMLEAGYQPLEVSRQSAVENLTMPEGWYNSAFYKSRYTHHDAANLVCLVTGVPLGSLIVINGLVEESNFKSQQLQVKADDFVQDTNQDAPKCYKNLERLSRLVKDIICLPVLQEMREVLGLPNSHGLLGLTYELKLKILSYLDTQSLLKMDQTCTHCHSLARDQFLWRRLYLRQFGSRRNNSLSQDWYQFYKTEHKARTERRKALHQMTLITPNPLWASQPRPHPAFGPIYPYSGIVGGDYDLNPQFQGIPDPLFGQRNQVRPPLARPRFDPIGPNPFPPFMPGQGRGMRNSSSRGWFGALGGGPQFF